MSTTTEIGNNLIVIAAMLKNVDDIREIEKREYLSDIMRNLNSLTDQLNNVIKNLRLPVGTFINPTHPTYEDMEIYQRSAEWQDFPDEA